MFIFLFAMEGDRFLAAAAAVRVAMRIEELIPN